MSNPNQIPAAVRAYAIPKSGVRKKRKPQQLSREDWPDWTLTMYCSTHEDASQRLHFGGYQVYFRGELIEKGIFYADDLDGEERRHLIRLIRGLIPQTNPEVRLKIISRTTFLKGVFFKVANKAKGAVVGIELPYHLSRLAVDWGEARKGAAEGFSLILLDYEGKDGIRRPDAFFPRIGIKAIDSQRSLIGFTSAWRSDDSGSKSKRRSKRHFRGHFLDCLTLANAHTGARNSLHEACAAFGVGYSEYESLSKTEISVDAISSLLHRLDVIWELYQALLMAHWRHPISLPPDKTYSLRIDRESIFEGYETWNAST